jgi:hypothetical protein
MSFLLGISNAIVPGTGLFIILNTAIFYISIFLYSQGLPRVSWFTTLLTIGICLNHLVLIYNGIVWKDVLFANLCLLGFASTLFSYRRYHPTRWGIGASIISLFAFALSMLLRPQGILVAFTGVLILSLNWQSHLFFNYKGNPNVSHFLKRLIIPVLLHLLVCLVLAKLMTGIVALTAVSYSTNTAVIGTRILLVYDIAGIVYREPETPLSVFQALTVNTTALQAEILRHYTSSRFDYLSSPGLVYKYLQETSTSDLSKQWVQAISARPLAYISHRISLFSWQMGLHDQAQCLPNWLGVSREPANVIQDLKLNLKESQFVSTLYVYAQKFINTFFNAPLTYLVLSICGLGILSRHVNPKTLPIIGLAIAGIVFALTYLFIGIACDLRYVYFSIVAGMITGLYAVSALQSES